MATLNKVLLIGNLTRDPELRYTPSGMPVCKLGLAVNNDYMDKTTQEKKKDTLFVNCSVFGKTGENAAQYLKKGSPAFIEGRLRLNSWENDRGEKRSTMEVIADRVQFLSQRGDDQQGGGEQAATAGAGTEDDIPF